VAYPVDTLGLPMHALVHAADIQDRDGGILVLASMFGLYPFLEKLFADGGYQGPRFRNALAKQLPQLSGEIVKRSDSVKGFKVLQDAGSWSGRLLGSTAADDWPRFSRTRTVTFSYHPASVDQADAAKAEQFPMILFGRTLTLHAFAANGRRVRSFPKAGRTLIKAATPASTG
jgi:hypothetical protein